MCGGRGTGITHFIGWSGLRSFKYCLIFGWFVLSTSGQDKPFQGSTADWCSLWKMPLGLTYRSCPKLSTYLHGSFSFSLVNSAFGFKRIPTCSIVYRLQLCVQLLALLNSTSAYFCVLACMPEANITTDKNVLCACIIMISCIVPCQ